jgi:hypothetical protein
LICHIYSSSNFQLCINELISLTHLKDFHKYENLRVIQIDRVAFGNTLCNMLYQCRSRNSCMISNSQFDFVLEFCFESEINYQKMTGTTLNLLSSWLSKKSLRVRQQSACISGRLTIQVPETGTRRCVYLKRIDYIRNLKTNTGGWVHWPCSCNACGFDGFYVFNHQLNRINGRFTRYENDCKLSGLRGRKMAEIHTAGRICLTICYR